MDYHQVHAVCTSNMAVTEIRIISLDMAFHENNGGTGSERAVEGGSVAQFGLEQGYRC